MTTQLTEAGRRVHQVMLETGAIHGNEMTPERLAALNAAAQILLPPEGGGLRAEDETRRANYAEGRRQHWQHEAERLAWMVRHLGGDPEDTFTPTAAPKTSVPGNDAGMRDPKCPIGLDATPGICSAGPCYVCASERAALSPPAGLAGDDETGVREAWVVSNGKTGSAERWRCWGEWGPAWSLDTEGALQFARRVDAERFCAEDEGAWRIVNLAAQPPKAETPAGDVFTRRVHGRTVLGVADLVEERVRQGVEPGANFPSEWLPFLVEGLRAALAPAARAGDGVDYPHLPLRILETEDRHGVRCPILIADAANNDIAEFYHSEQASVGQSYDQALTLARRLVTLTAAPAANGEGA